LTAKQENSSFQSNSKVAYYILNIIFMAIIMAIFIYSALYRINEHPIPALLTERTGIIPPSKGLSAGFSEIVRGNFSEALVANTHTIRIFSFFALQFLLRIVSIILIKKEWLSLNRIIATDISVSIILFVVSFGPLIIYTLKLFSQILH